MSRILCFCFALQFSLTPLLADVFTVGPSGAHATVQSAVDAAVATGGDNEIRVQEGMFSGTVVVPAQDLTGDVVISGGWNDTFDVQTEDASLTALSGDMASRVIDISGIGTGSVVSIQNLTVRDGFDMEEGAGIRIDCQQSQVELLDLQIVENLVGNDQNSQMRGSAIHALLRGDTHLIVDSCEIYGNRIDAVNNASATVNLRTRGTSTVTVRDNSIHDNLVESQDRSAGGGAIGVFLEDNSGLTLTGNTCRNNTVTSGGSTTAGGGMEMAARDTSSFLVEGNDFRSNRTVTSTNSSTGAGVYLEVEGQAEGSFSYNTIVDNQAMGEGSASGPGAAIWLRDEARVAAERNFWFQTLDLVNQRSDSLSLISANSSALIMRDSVVAGSNAGGISGITDHEESILRLSNFTLADNAGSAISTFRVGTMSFYNSIVFNNGSNSTPDEGTETGSNLVETDPFFVDAENGDYHLMPGSPAVDVADSDPPGGLGEFDLDGEDRDWGGRVDIGAYEVAPSDQTIQYLAQVGNGQAGTIVLSTEIDAASTASEGAEGFTLEFLDSSGAPWEVGVKGELPAGENRLSSVSVLLDPGESWSLETSGLGT